MVFTLLPFVSIKIGTSKVDPSKKVAVLGNGKMAVLGIRDLASILTVVLWAKEKNAGNKASEQIIKKIGGNFFMPNSIDFFFYIFNLLSYQFFRRIQIFFKLSDYLIFFFGEISCHFCVFKQPDMVNHIFP